MSTPSVITATPTAFHADGSLDEDGSRAIFEYVARSGNEGVFVLGTTGEFPSLSMEERGRLASIAVETLGSSMRVVVHVGASSAFEVLGHIERARSAGAREIAVLTPYYLRATDTAMIDFFRTVSAASDGLDVFVYAYARRTGNTVSAQLMSALAQLPHIVGAKVSEEPLEQLAAYRAVVPDDFLLYTGADRDILRIGDVGAQGVVSGVSSVLPRPFRAAAALAGSDDGRARHEAQLAIDEVCDAVGGDMARMKVAYTLLGVPVGTTTRMAIEPPDAAALELVQGTVRRHG
jgi:dihydrodipicolinate synthase/N-acetylneuraminate lyase